MHAVDRGVLNNRFEMIIYNVKRNYGMVPSSRTHCEPVVMSGIVQDFKFVLLFYLLNHTLL